MSNALAIATVTQALQRVLTAALPPQVGGAVVRALRPDDDQLRPPIANPIVNIFLYQVSPNTAWRNADLPTRRSDGTPLRRPQAALDLHYLFTFYGDDATLDAQRLLGAVVRQFHAAPALSRDDIKAVQVGFLAGADLADQIELVRFTPVNFSLEEMSKLWSVFLKTDYALSVAYTASVVLIETDDPPPAAALPVLRPCLTAVPFSLAAIDAVEPQPLELSASPPTPITLVGRNLDAGDDVEFTTPGSAGPLFGSVQGGDNERLTVLPPAGLRAGVNTVRLTRRSAVPSPPASPPACAPHVVSQSNTAPFILRPRMLGLTRDPVTGKITVNLSPLVGADQEASLILNQVGSASPPGGPGAFTVPADPHPSETGALLFSTAFPGGSVPAGTYLARARVDGAESALTRDASGRFDGPVVVIP